jgi:hypothetical protein
MRNAIIRPCMSNDRDSGLYHSIAFLRQLLCRLATAERQALSFTAITSLVTDKSRGFIVSPGAAKKCLRQHIRRHIPDSMAHTSGRPWQNQPDNSSYLAHTSCNTSSLQSLERVYHRTDNGESNAESISWHHLVAKDDDSQHCLQRRLDASYDEAMSGGQTTESRKAVKVKSRTVT